MMLFEGVLKNRNGVMTYTTPRTQRDYAQFKERIPDGATIHVFMELESEDGSLGQLAKVHKLIRILAQHTGNSFDDMKLMVKDRAGLCIIREIQGKEYFTCKSFSKCSAQDLGFAIQAAIEIGQQVNLNLS
jgi:hypothetical protein